MVKPLKVMLHYQCGGEKKQEKLHEIVETYNLFSRSLKVISEVYGFTSSVNYMENNMEGMIQIDQEHIMERERERHTLPQFISK